MTRTIAAFLAATLPLATLADGRLLVVNKEDDTVSVLSLADGAALATWPNNEGPHEVAVTPDGRFAVVTDYAPAGGGRSLTVHDLTGRSKPRTIDLGEHRRPHGIAFAPDGTAVVTTEGCGHLITVDVHTGKLLQAIETKQDVSHSVALSPDGRTAYVANIGSGSLSVVDLGGKGRLVKNLPTGEGAEGVAVTADGREIWVSNRATDTISVVDAKSLDIVATLASEGFPIRVAMTPDGAHALVTNATAGTLAVFDVKARREVARVKLAEDEGGMLSKFFGQRGPVPIGVVPDPGGQRVYVALAGGDRVAVVDTATWTVSVHWQTGDEPDGLAIAPGLDARAPGG